MPVERFAQVFAKRAVGKDAVWYYREAGDAGPHVNAMVVMRAIVDTGLPISMSTKDDFSDVVLPDGTTKPREAR